MTRRGGLGSLLLAGAAAYAYYKYSQMSEEQKKNLVNGWKEKGKKFYDESIPQSVKDLFGKKASMHSGANGQPV